MICTDRESAEERTRYKNEKYLWKEHILKSMTLLFIILIIITISFLFSFYFVLAG